MKYLASICIFTATLLVPMSVLAKSGEQTYLQHCARCHGKDGDSVMPRASNLKQKEGLRKPDAALLERIKKGGRICPSYDGILRDPEIVRLISHLRTL